MRKLALRGHLSERRTLAGRLPWARALAAAEGVKVTLIEQLPPTGRVTGAVGQLLV